MADVFISYAREDRARAEQIARGLEAQGYDVFWDNEIPPGQTWADYTEAKLTQSKVTVVLWTASSVASQWVREEARMARDKGKLIPVLLDGSMPPFGFGEVQGADLSAWRGEANNPAFARVVEAIRNATGGPSGPPNPALLRTPPRPAFTPAPAAADAGALSPIGYVQKCLRMYVNANGRARRAEYWWWVAFVLTLAIIAAVIDSGMGAIPGEGPVGIIVSLALAAPGICVGVRRLHDIGMSGWWFAAAFAALIVASALAAIPALALIGLIILLAVAVTMIFFLVKDSQPGDNKYGPNPKSA